MFVSYCHARNKWLQRSCAWNAKKSLSKAALKELQSRGKRRKQTQWINCWCPETIYYIKHTTFWCVSFLVENLCDGQVLQSKAIWRRWKPQDNFQSQLLPERWRNLHEISRKLDLPLWYCNILGWDSTPSKFNTYFEVCIVFWLPQIKLKGISKDKLAYEVKFSHVISTWKCNVSNDLKRRNSKTDLFQFNECLNLAQN